MITTTMTVPTDATHPIAPNHAVEGPLMRLFERRISRAITSMLLPLSVRPSFTTAVSLTIGLAGAGLLATTDHLSRVHVAASSVWATTVEGCDRGIARSKLVESPFEPLYETAVDLAGGGVLSMAVVDSVQGLSARQLAPSPERNVLDRARGALEWFATAAWCYLVLVLAVADQIVHLSPGHVAWHRA